jgi:protocatechuate 3,4-dioxygenase beta subunit
MKLAEVLLLSGVALCAQTPPVGSGAAAPPGSATGHAWDADSGAPLVGVRVASGNRKVTTDTDGDYTLSGLPPGTMQISVVGGFYMDDPAFGTRVVNVVSGSEISGIDFHVRLPGEISGRVVDEHGQPLPNIGVRAIRRDYCRDRFRCGVGLSLEHGNNRLRYHTQMAATTDDRGEYLIQDIYPGMAYLILADIDRRYSNPISDASVDPLKRGQSLEPTYYPGAASVAGATLVIVRSQERRDRVDVHMLHSTSYCLEATLTLGGRPATLGFGIDDEEVVGVSSYPPGQPLLRGESRGDGKIRVCDMYSGRFQLSAFQASRTSNPAYAGAVSVTISKEDVGGVTVAAAPAVTVFGELAWDGDPPVERANAPRIRVSQYPALPVLRAPWTSVPGEFAFDALRDLDYSLFVSGISPPSYVKDITYGGMSILHKPLIPVAGGKVRIMVGQDGGSVSARVVDRDGKPVGDCWVAVLPASAPSEAELAESMAAGHTDQNGVYSADGLAPGRYFVLATSQPVDKTPETIGKLLRGRILGQEVVVEPRGFVQLTVSPKFLD